MRTTNYIHYEDLIKREWFIKEMQRNGLVIIPKDKHYILGYAVISLGLITWFIPFTTIPLICLGVYMLGISQYKLKEKIRKKIKGFHWK